MYKVIMKDVFDFFKKVETWVLKKTRQPTYLVSFEHGQKVLFFGKEYTVTHIKGLTNRVFIDNDQFIISKRSESFSTIPLVHTFLKKSLHAKIQDTSSQHAAQIGVTFEKISIKKMTSRWGSCSSNGRLSYALNLVFAPTHIIDYVCAHEVAHLKHMNHSANFWSCVQTLYPNYKLARKWLKDNGQSLFIYQLT